VNRSRTDLWGGRLGNHRLYPEPHRCPVAVLPDTEADGWAARGELGGYCDTRSQVVLLNVKDKGDVAVFLTLRALLHPPLLAVLLTAGVSTHCALRYLSASPWS
jgi:hypothetical protein